MPRAREAREARELEEEEEGAFRVLPPGTDGRGRRAVAGGDLRPGSTVLEAHRVIDVVL